MKSSKDVTGMTVNRFSKGRSETPEVRGASCCFRALQLLLGGSPSGSCGRMA